MDWHRAVSHGDRADQKTDENRARILTHKIMVEAADIGQPVDEQGDANCSKC